VVFSTVFNKATNPKKPQGSGGNGQKRIFATASSLPGIAQLRVGRSLHAIMQSLLRRSARLDWCVKSYLLARAADG
jgi:hypothetical protein